jgi:prepilin-type processing-associated H-X9-DG protein
MWLDAAWRGGGPMNDGMRGAAPRAPGKFMSRNAEMAHFCVDRHDMAINAVFADGHTEKLGLRRLWYLAWHRGWVDGNARMPPWLAALPPTPEEG